MIKQKRWFIQEQNSKLVEHIKATHNLDDYLAKILINRDIIEDKEIERFLLPDKKKLYGPFLLKDMDKAVERIVRAVSNKELITIYGDYDVDGITSTSLIFLFLREIGALVNYYIPDRVDEGYGINKEALKEIKEQGCRVLISVDTGIAAFDEAIYAKDLGLDMIITDHHECQGSIPEAFAVINPKRPDCEYPFKLLAGVGVTFKLVHGISIELGITKSIWPYLHLVAVGTIADIVPLIDENRIMTKIAFDTLGATWNIGLKALMDVSAIKPETLCASDIGFRIGPRLNAAGRLGDAKRGVELFTTDNEEEAIRLAKELDEENKKRQGIEKQILQEALEIIESSGMNEHNLVLVVAGHGWNHGVMGIVASRIVGRYYKPTIILSMEDGKATGSARSIEGFNIFEALSASKSLFEKYGGHEMAAGMSLPEKDVDELRLQLNQYGNIHLTEALLLPKVSVDFDVPIEHVTEKFIRNIQLLEPYGAANPEPMFLIDGIVQQARRIGKEQNHLKVVIGHEDQTLDTIGFSMGSSYDYLPVDTPIRVVGSLNLNEWQNRFTPQMMAVDIKYAKILEDDISESLYMLSNMTDDLLAYIRAQNQLPSRDDFKIIYRILMKCDTMKTTDIPILRLLEDFESTKTKLIKPLICMKVLSEVGLVKYHFDYHTIVFNMIHLDNGKKVELEQSKLYNKLITH
ncbi:MAG: single-stranded-DNA-specific exonuclease RecJ [Vallitaleaceae bacterium]|jgi:single-stranded-DNA-specific exonuclease|nr:single-stranded-DNA-specific exonuclease RecJ [Vallitaleaceae bacterium]